MLRVGGTEVEETRVTPVRACVCLGEGQVVFISGGVWQEELSDVEADSKKELGSSKSSSSTGGIGIGIAQDVQRSSSCRDYYSNGQLKVMSECVVLMGRRTQMSEMGASRRSNIKGKGCSRRQRLDIWDGVEEGRCPGRGGGYNPDRSDSSTQTIQHTRWMFVGSNGARA